MSGCIFRITLLGGYTRTYSSLDLKSVFAVKKLFPEAISVEVVR